MAAFTNQAGVARYLGSKPARETVTHTQAFLLDELPGLAFAIVTLVWVAASFAQLVL